VDRRVLSAAIGSPIKDFEDAVLIEAGDMEAVDAVVTRDPDGFQEGRLRILSPQQLEAILSQ